METLTDSVKNTWRPFIPMKCTDVPDQRPIESLPKYVYGIIVYPEGSSQYVFISKTMIRKKNIS